MLTRRELLRTSCRLAPVLAGGAVVAAAGERAAAASGLDELVRTAPRARWWTSVAQAGANCAACHGDGAGKLPAHRHAPGLVRCQLCARSCAIPPGQAGACRARFN